MLSYTQNTCKTSLYVLRQSHNEAFQPDTMAWRKDSIKGCRESTQMAVDKKTKNFASNVLQVKI